MARAGHAAAGRPILLVATALTETLGGAELTETVNPIGFLPEWMGYAGLLGIVAILPGACRV